MTEHEHACARCSHVWRCRLRLKGKRTPCCEVAKAAKVNKQGPFCDLCYHEEMAARIRRARGLRAAADPEPALREAVALCEEMFRRTHDWSGPTASSHYRSDICERIQKLRAALGRSCCNTPDAV